MRYTVVYEGDKAENFDYIKDAAEAWIEYPFELECYVYDNVLQREVDPRDLECVLGQKKTGPCKLKPRSKVAYMYA